jgi:Taurine catabolism dioxygenase TauD, TfdA family
MLQHIEGRAGWTGAELEASGDWIRTLDAAQCQEIADAVASVTRRGLPLFGFGRGDFSLTRTAPLLAEISEELENGRGVVRLRGLDVTRFSLEELRHAFWGIGCHLGTPLFQNATGETMGEVRDESRLAAQTYEPVEPGKVASSRSRTRGAGPLRWHTDRCDVIALLCARNARSGGISKLASIVTIYNEIGRRRPDLLELLCKDYWRSRPKDEDGGGVERAFALPVFGVLDGKLTCQYSRTYVEQAQEYPEVPRLSAAQNEALDLLAAVADQECLYCPFQEGDIQLLNNHVVFHGRTAYEDGAETRNERLLLRLWLTVVNSRRLPVGHEILWGAVEPGALRGGVVQPGTDVRVATRAR